MSLKWVVVVDGVKLGELELLVVLAALRLGEERASPVSIGAEILETSGRRVQRATVYVLLKRLEEKGCVETFLGEALAERGGRPPRMVRVTEEGRFAVRAVRRTLEAMWGDLDPEVV